MNSPELKLYGLRISYYTGKMEAYLRYKQIPFEFVVLNPDLMKQLKEKTGAAQMPAIELSDGRFMTDTTPMIQWLEGQYAQFPVIPDDPMVRFISLLLEDYAEEWLWRPAMHYRWSYEKDRLHLGRKIVDELLSDAPGPKFMKRRFIQRRQHVEYVKRDGVDANTWYHVESIYLRTLDRLEDIFSTRDFLLGEHPTVADFGFFASMFRHFGQDPTASDIMRLRAPGVFAWQARLWNARGSDYEGSVVASLPGDLAPLLTDVGQAYLPYLNQNALAWQQGQAQFDPMVEDVQYRNVPVSQYRVWCLEELQRHARALQNSEQSQLQQILEDSGSWQALLAIEEPASRYDEGRQAPFRGRKVHYHNRRD